MRIFLIIILLIIFGNNAFALICDKQTHKKHWRKCIASDPTENAHYAAWLPKASYSGYIVDKVVQTLNPNFPNDNGQDALFLSGYIASYIVCPYSEVSTYNNCSKLQTHDKNLFNFYISDKISFTGVLHNTSTEIMLNGNIAENFKFIYVLNNSSVSIHSRGHGYQKHNEEVAERKYQKDNNTWECIKGMMFGIGIIIFAMILLGILEYFYPGRMI